MSLKTKEALEEYEKDRREWLEKLKRRYRVRTKTAGAGFFRPKGGGGGEICVYPGCENEAIGTCNLCYLPYCAYHIASTKHHCLPFHIASTIKYLNREKLTDIGKAITESPKLEYSFNLMPRENVIKDLTPLLPRYEEYIKTFTVKQLAEEANLTEQTVKKYLTKLHDAHR